MPFTHSLLALAVVFVWGTNFVVIRWGLDAMPPFFFAALRFGLSALPFALFMPRPRVPWHTLAAFGMLLGMGQFGLLYFAIGGFISPGLASLVVQAQVFFTIGIAMFLMRERLQRYQVLGLLAGLAGLLVIAGHLDASVTATGLSLVLAAAFFWACANMVAKSAGKVNMLHFTVWASVFAAPPLFLLSWLTEGWGAIHHGLVTATPLVWSSVVWQAAGNTLFGFGVWNWLLSRHPAAAVTPMALLVPVFGMSASAMSLGEALPGWKLLACALVLGGLAIIVLWPRWRSRLASS
ncbi:EamA family transporter [Hydrogenophaga sp. 5NK40-0174]|uniref:EamA family transporter n=1 Tax=Hydrogenophaga sp. 5NK40-0174 TaxID=3127649 RepID=UPI00310475ED